MGVNGAVYEHPTLENIICNRFVSACLDAQPSPPHICQNPLPLYHYLSLYRRRRSYLNIESALILMVM